jgi:hypothetical protein
VTRPNLLAQDCIGRRVTVLIRDAETPSKILFRADDIALRPEMDDETVRLRYTDEFAERGTRLRIEVRDAETDEVLTTAVSVLKAQLDAW